MNLATNVQDQIRRYVAGLVSADDLSDWLDAHAQQIHDAGDGELRRLMDLTFSLLEDEIQGHRSEDDVRALLTAEIPTAHTIAFEVVAFASTASSTGTVATESRDLGFQPMARPWEQVRTDSPMALAQ